jgi:lipopolysaccharide export system permease protein
MNIIARYIARRFLFWWLLCAASLVGLFSFFDLAAQIDDLEAGYQLADALTYVALKVPGCFIETAPPAILLAGVTTLGIFAEHRELLAIQAAGITSARIAWHILKPALAILLLLMLMGQFVAPPLEQRAWILRKQGRSQTGTFLPHAGFWTRQGRQFVNLRPGTAAQAIEIYRFDAAGQLETLVQAPGFQPDDSDHWVLRRARITHFTKREMTRHTAAELRIPRLLSATETRELNLPAQTLSFTELSAVIKNLQKRQQYTGSYRVVWWQKLTLPLLSLSMLALAFPFTLGRPYQEGLGWRIMVGAIIGVLGYFIHQVFVNLGLLWSWPAPLTVLMPGVIFLLAVPLLRQRHR